MMYYFDGASPFHMFGFIFMPLLWALGIYGVILFIQWILGGSNANIDSDQPLKILKERYAKGEITREEFERIKKDIK